MNKKTGPVRLAHLPSAMLLGAVALAGCGGGGGSSPTNTLPDGITQHSVTTYSATTVATPVAGLTAATQDLLTGGLGKSGLAVAAPVPADPAEPDGAGAAPQRPAFQLPRHPGPQRRRWLRIALRSQRHRRRRRHEQRRLDSRARIRRVARRRQRPQEGRDRRAVARQLRRRQPLRGGRAVLRLARRLWRDRHGRRMGPQARLRRGTDRRRQGRRPVRPDGRLRQPDRRHARHPCGGRRAEFLRGQRHRRGPRGLQRAVPQPAGAQAGALPAQSREGLGHRHAGSGPLCAVRAERPLRHGREPGAVPRRQHAGDRRLRVQRRRGGAPRGRTGHDRPRRRRGGVGAGGRDADGLGLWHPVRWRRGGRLWQDAGRLRHLRQPVPALRCAGRAGRDDGSDVLQLHHVRRHDRTRDRALRRAGRQGAGHRRRHGGPRAGCAEQAARLRLDARTRPDAQRPLRAGQRADPVGHVPRELRAAVSARQRVQHQLRAGRRHRQRDCRGRCHEGAELRHGQWHGATASPASVVYNDSVGGAQGLAVRRLAVHGCRRTSAWTTPCASGRW